MIDDPFWAWVLIAMFFIVLIAFIYFIVFNKHARKRRDLLSEYIKKENEK